MKVYKIFVTGLYVGCKVLNNQQVNKLISDKNISLKEL